MFVIQTDNYKRDIIDPAIDATVGILKSAAKAKSVRRVVITSSMATLLTMEYIMSDDFTKVFTSNLPFLFVVSYTNRAKQTILIPHLI